MIKVAYLAITSDPYGGGYFGAGWTIEEAKKNLYEAGGSKKYYELHRNEWNTEKCDFFPDAVLTPEQIKKREEGLPYVDGYCRMCYYGKIELIEKIEPKKKKTR